MEHKLSLEADPEGIENLKVRYHNQRMPTPHTGSTKGILEQIARRVMKESDFHTDFSAAALDELEKLSDVDSGAKSAGRDLRRHFTLSTLRDGLSRMILRDFSRVKGIRRWFNCLSSRNIVMYNEYTMSCM